MTTQVRKEQINILRTYWSVFTYSATAGTSSTTIIAGTLQSSSVTQIPGGNPTSSPPVRGIVTTGSGAFVRLRRVDTALSVTNNDLQIFGRLTFNGTNYVINYKVISGGAEISATLPGVGIFSIQMMFPEVMNFGEVPTNADIIYGSFQELLPSGNNIFGNFTINGNAILKGNTTLGDSFSDTITLGARFITDLIPSPDNTISLGSSSLRFANVNSTQYTARADATNTVKSIFNASGIMATGTGFDIDGNSTVMLGNSTATGITIGRTGVTTTVNGTFNPTNNTVIGGNLTVNGGSSTFNGDVTVTGILTFNSLSIIDLIVPGNTTLGDNATVDTIDMVGRMISDIVPKFTNTYNLGSSSLRFKELNVTTVFARADDVNSAYSSLSSDSLSSTVTFDIDGYDTLFIGATHALAINIGRAGITTTVDGYMTIDNGAKLNTVGTGNINLPNNIHARFLIEGASVGATVTAANLNDLTNGSNADELHFHTGTNLQAISGEAIHNGAPIGYEDGYGDGYDGYGDPRVFNCDANVDGYRHFCAGIANETVPGADNLIIFVTNGEKLIPDVIWDTVPIFSDVGKIVFLSENKGKLTVHAPTTEGAFVQKIGIISSSGSGTSKIIISLGDSYIN